MTSGDHSSVRWWEFFPAEIMVCDGDGTILEMNTVSIALYSKQGGAALIGSNVFEHHTEPARSQVKAMVEQKKPVIYTTERAGQKKLVCIAPWGRPEAAGSALVVLDLPSDMPNIRKD
jgi:hypothetical protein